VNEVLQKAAPSLAGKPAFPSGKRMFSALPELTIKDLNAEDALYLSGRYAINTSLLLESAQPGELEHIEDTPNLWAELRWAARSEAVVHLEDLLLRRVRLGLVASGGGMDLLPGIRSIVQPELGWDNERWQSEEQAYRRTWLRYYSPTPGNL
jgi:glycerol-3-phosphate dehydrogenase